MRNASHRMFLLFALIFCGSGPILAEIQVETVQIPAAPGVQLASDVYRDGGLDAAAQPVILMRTPYGRSGLDYVARPLAARGYTVVAQDVRGKYDSTGEYVPFTHERADGTAALKWTAKQKWCDGNIGMWGNSYGAFSALAVADVEIDAFRSFLAFSGWSDAYDIVQPGGALHLMLDLPWMITQQGQQQRGLGQFDIEALFRHTPLSQALRASGIANSVWEDPAWLEDASLPTAEGPARRPGLHITGWHDMVYRASLRAWSQLSEGAEAPQKLVIGPWYHDQTGIGEFEVGDANFGEASGFGTDELIALTLRWFDATLKGQANGALEEPPVRYFMMEQNVWQTAATWPPMPDVQVRRFYLDSAGKANGSGGDGVLTEKKPSGAATDRFTYDPLDPVPTFGGANFHYFPERLGVRDQAEIERRADVLVYTSPPVEEELQITGRVEARLHVATSGKDTDFTAKLVVLRPDGYARIVEEGIARASAQLDTVPPPGETFALDVTIGDTAIAVRSGERLRLEVSSSNFPKYDRNPNTGEHPFTATKFVSAEQTVLHSAKHPSHVQLPVRRSPARITAQNRKPLIEPVADAGMGVARASGNDADALIEQGRQQLRDKQIDEAIASFERVVELRPGDSEGYHQLGQAYLAKLNTVSMFAKLRLSKLVRASYGKAIELDPANVEARESLAQYYFNAPGVAGGSTKKGMEQVAQIKQHAPKQAHVLLAGHYAGKKDYDAAIVEYRAALAIDPADADLYYLLGLRSQQAKQWDGAFQAFADGWTKTADYRALYQIGRTAVFADSHLDRAKQALEQYIADAPEGPALPSVAHARWRLGMVYEKLDQKDQARSQYEQALKLQPDMEEAREALQNLG